jgi:alpha-beta hydrolase superfamily lysophospholipase
VQQIKYPFFVAHGVEDSIIKREGSQLLYDKALQAKDKKIIMYDGLVHEILNEPEKDKVMQDLVNWYDSHL